MKFIYRYAAVVLTTVLLLLLPSKGRGRSGSNSCIQTHNVCMDTHGISAVPSLVLWAWERPEDLRFLSSTRVGVAFLAASIHLAPTGMSYRPRMQPLLVDRKTRLVAVVRIETKIGAPLEHEIAMRVAGEIARASRLPGVVMVQVDFDATVSERAFYRELLVEVRRQLPDSMPISITALSSWCIGDRWMSGLPIDEAVPMLFRMGVGQSDVMNWMRSGHDFREGACRSSLGISLDERWAKLPVGRRVYAFSPSAWTDRSLQNLTRELEAWQ